jgi:steroid delta-isomerase-like uncharacterized protein
MSAEENKAVIRRWVELWNTKSLDAVAEFVTPDYVRHDPNSPEIRGAVDEAQFVRTVLTAFPDFHITIDKMIAEGDTVVGRFTFRGTQRGEFSGIPPTQKQVVFTATETFRLQGNRIAEQWVSMDTLGLLQQLGVIPSPGQASS